MGLHTFLGHYRKILPLDSESVSFDNRADEIGRKVIRTT